MREDPKSIEILADSFTLCACGGMTQTGNADLMLPIPKDNQVLEGVHAALLVCPACKAKIPCKVKIDFHRYRGN